MDKKTIWYLQHLQHGLQVLSNGERCFRLALDLIHCHTIRNLDKGQAVGKVDVEDTLRRES